MPSAPRLQPTPQSLSHSIRWRAATTGGRTGGGSAAPSPGGAAVDSVVRRKDVHGVEYAFGAHDYSISGVFEVEPRQCPGFKFRKSIYMGTTCLDPLQVREFMEIQSVNYNGDTYHLISKNCNHFCEDICKRLTGNLIPKWVNRLARMGAVCNCILPESLKINAVCHDPDGQAEDSEKRRLTGAFSCFSSISLCQRHFSTSSLFLRTPAKGTSWDTKQSSSDRLKKS